MGRLARSALRWITLSSPAAERGWENKIPLLLLLPVSRTASDEIRQNMMACVVAGALANLAEVWG